MHNATGIQLNDHKYVQRSKEQVVDNSEITSPDVAGVILQEDTPGLTCVSWCVGHLLLDRTLADHDPQLQQLSANAFCTPQQVVPAYLLDELDDNQWDA